MHAQYHLQRLLCQPGTTENGRIFQIKITRSSVLIKFWDTHDYDPIKDNTIPMGKKNSIENKTLF
jgi:hypothetical protein